MSNPYAKIDRTIGRAIVIVSAVPKGAVPLDDTNRGRFYEEGDFVCGNFNYRAVSRDQMEGALEKLNKHQMTNIDPQTGERMYHLVKY